MSNTAEATPPYDIEVEQAVLGVCLCDNSKINEISADLDPKHFYDPFHQRLYEMIIVLSGEGDVTPLIVNSVMKHDPGLREVGGHSYLAGLVMAAPAMPDIKRLSGIIIEFYQRRGLIKIGEGIIDSALSTQKEIPVKKIADDATERLLKVTSAVQRDRVTMYGLAGRILEQAERVLRGERIPAVLTGLQKFDDVTGGLRGGEHVICAGRSGMSKTANLVSLANGAALNGHPVLIFNLDMRLESWGERALCELDQRRYPYERPIWTSKFRHGTLSNHEIERLAEAQRMLADLPFEICDEPTETAASIFSRSRSFASKYQGGKIGLIVVDYLQTVEIPPDLAKREGRARALGDVAKMMRQLSRTLNWPVLTACQLLNKGESASDEDHIPTAQDIRESGEIEASADIIFAPYRKAFFVRRREPDKNLRPDKWDIWRSELTECDHALRYIGLKFRDVDQTKLNLDLWCDMGCNAIRDERPIPPQAPDESARQLLMDVG